MSDLASAKQSFFIFVRDPVTGKVNHVAVPGDVQIGLMSNPADLTLLGRLAVNVSEYQITAQNNVITAGADDCIIGIKLVSSPPSLTARVMLPQNPREGQLAFVKDMSGTSVTVPITLDPGKGLLIDDQPTASLATAYGSTMLAWFDGQWRTVGGGGSGGGGIVTSVLGAGGSTVTHVGTVYTVSSSIGVSSVIGVGGSAVTRIGTGTEYQVSSSVYADAYASYAVISASAENPNARTIVGTGGVQVIDQGVGNSIVWQLAPQANPGSALDGQEFLLPRISDFNSTTYNCANLVSVSGTLGGDPNVLYYITLRFRGVVEQKTYTGGVSDGFYFQEGGVAPADTYNIYSLQISDPPAIYYLNKGTSGQQKVFLIDYIKTLPIRGSASVILTADSGGDSLEVANNINTGGPLSVPGITSPAQPFLGQFIVINFISSSVRQDAGDVFVTNKDYLLPSGAYRIINAVSGIIAYDDARKTWPFANLSIDNTVVATLTGSTFSGPVTSKAATGGFTGSLTQTGILGNPFMVGVGAVSVTTNSLGQIIVSGSANSSVSSVTQITTTPNSSWVTVVDIPFDAQPSQTFTGNSSVSIDGYNFVQLNPGNASAAAVIPGTGVQWTNSAADDIFGGTFSAPALTIQFQNLFSGYSLPDHDVRIWWWINQDSVSTNFDAAVYGVLLGGTASGSSGFAPSTENITNKKGFLNGGQGYNPQLNINATNYLNASVLGFETYNVQMLQYNRNGRSYAWYIGSGSNDVWPGTNQMQLLVAGDANPNNQLFSQLPITGSGNPSVFLGLMSTGGRAIVESFRRLRFDYLSSNNVGIITQGQGAYYGFVTSSVWWVTTGSWQPFLSACPDNTVTDVFSQGVFRSGSSFTVTHGGLYGFHAGFNAYGSDAYISLRLSSSAGIALSRTTYRTDPADQNLVNLDGIFSASIGQTFTLQYVTSGTVFAWTGSNPLPGIDAAPMHTGEISVFLLNTSGSSLWIDKGNVLVTTASVSIDGQALTAVQGSGVDTYLWVSGTQSVSGAWNSPSAVTGSAARRAVFGGDVVISGTLSALRGSPFSPWTTLLDVDFTAQPAQTLGSDGFYDLAGLTWFKSNTANENAPTTIGSAGLTFAPTTSTDYTNTTRSGPLLWLPLSQSLLLPNLDWTYSFRLWVYVTVDNPSVNFDECILGLDNNGTTISMFFARGMDPAGGTGGFMRNIVNGSNISSQNNISFTTSSLNNVMILEWNVLSRQTTATVNSSTPRLFTHAMSGTVTNSSWPPYRTSTYQSMWDTSTLNPSNTFNGLGVVLGAVRGGGGSAHYSCSIGRIRLDYHA